MRAIIYAMIISYAIVSVGCKSTKEEAVLKDYPTIKLDLSNEPVFIRPDSLLGEKVIIPLETTEESIIGEIDKLEIVHDTLYILDDDQDMIFLFDKTGKYITRIADIGRGPQEYLGIKDFHIDDSIIYVAADQNQKIFCYNLQGDFLHSFPIEGYFIQNITTDSNYIYVYHNFFHPQNWNVAVYNKKGCTLHKQYKYYPPQQDNSCYWRCAWTSCNNKVYASFPYEYNIYQLFPDTCKIIATYDCGKKNMFPKEWSTFSVIQLEDYIKSKGGMLGLPIASDIYDLFVTPKWFLFTFMYKSRKYMVFFNRQTQKLHFGTFKRTLYHLNTSPIVYVSDDYLVVPSDALSVIRWLDAMPEDAPERSLNIKEDDNPCLYFYKFKD